MNTFMQEGHKNRDPEQAMGGGVVLPRHFPSRGCAAPQAGLHPLCVGSLVPRVGQLADSGAFKRWGPVGVAGWGHQPQKGSSGLGSPWSVPEG